MTATILIIHKGLIYSTCPIRRGHKILLCGHNRGLSWHLMHLDESLSIQFRHALDLVRHGVHGQNGEVSQFVIGRYEQMQILVSVTDKIARSVFGGDDGGIGDGRIGLNEVDFKGGWGGVDIRCEQRGGSRVFFPCNYGGGRILRLPFSHQSECRSKYSIKVFQSQVLDNVFVGADLVIEPTTMETGMFLDGLWFWDGVDHLKRPGTHQQRNGGRGCGRNFHCFR
mmetsp:Transcript_30889/g.65286  ORF Transcript_30889/g.65286 Transcript_30889/m.65286 type:complete len:225 (+) Transcript_30889:363-1037(+)